MDIMAFVLDESSALESVTLAQAQAENLEIILMNCTDDELALLFPTFGDDQREMEQALVRRIVTAALDSSFDGCIWLVISDEEQENLLDSLIDTVWEELDPIDEE